MTISLSSSYSSRTVCIRLKPCMRIIRCCTFESSVIWQGVNDGRGCRQTYINALQKADGHQAIRVRLSHCSDYLGDLVLLDRVHFGLSSQPPKHVVLRRTIKSSSSLRPFLFLFPFKPRASTASVMPSAGIS